MQGTTLITRIIGPVFVLSISVMGMMMVHVVDPAAVAKVGGDILLVLEGMLDMDADQRHYAGCLGQYKKS